MADIEKVKRNINKMIDAGAPEQDIDSYLGTEGVSLNQLQAKSPSLGERIYENVVAPTVELGAAGGGALLGAAGGGPAGAVLGSGLLYGGAKRLTQAGGELLGFREPQTMEQVIPETIKDILTGSTFEAGGQVAGHVLKRAAQRFVTPEMLDRIRLSKETGVKLSPADVRQQKSGSLIESTLEKNIGSGNIVNQFRSEQIKQAEEFANQQIMKQGGRIDMLTAGAKIQESAIARQGAWKEIYKPVYNQLDDLIPKNTRIETPTLDAVANEFKGELSEIKHGTVNNILSKLTRATGNVGIDELGLRPYGKNISIKEWNWNTIDQTRKKLGDLIGESLRSGKNYEASIYTQLKNALDKDIELFANQSGGEIKNTFDLARQLFREGRGDIPGAVTFKNKAIIKNVLENANPETIVNTFIKPNNATNIKALVQTIGQEGMRPTKAAWLDKLFSLGPEQSFSPARFSTAWYKYDRQTLSQFLTQEEISGLDKLSKISNALKAAERIAGNPSGTGQTIGTFGALYLWVKHPIVMTAAEIGSKKFANLYFNNPTFRRYFTQGIDMKPGSIKLTEIMFKMSGIVAAEKVRDAEEDQ